VRSTPAAPRLGARLIAHAGLLAFGASLIYFVYCYSVGFGRVVPGAIEPSAIVIDVALFTAFAFHHSVFARDECRRLMTAAAGPLERSVYVWIASILFVVVCAAWRPIAGVAWQVDVPAIAWGLMAAQAFGVWLSLRSAVAIDILELAGIRQLQPGAAAPLEFLARGPYGWVRHPIYTGWFLIVFGAPVMTTTRLVFAIISSAYLLLAIPLEERSLRRAAPGAYERYMRHVRWRLLPGVY